MITTNPAEKLAASLGGKTQGDGWITCCPAHDDSKPSLSINLSKDGKVLVKCHAGCPQEAVIKALKDKNLWEWQQRPQPSPRQTNYIYNDSS